jgi:hypothetical protein
MKVKVNKEIAVALDKLGKDKWSKQFDLIGHCKSFSGNGIRMKSTFTQELEVLNNIPPLEFAKMLILGYEVE